LSLANVSYVNRNGKLISLNGGEHTYPQIVLANSIDDAYSVISDQEVNDLSYKYIYVDLNFCSDFDEDLEVIDDLICRGISLYFFYPENKEADLLSLKSRDFEEFAWRPSMVSDQMIETNREHGSYLLQNYRQNQIQPFLIAGAEDPFSALLSSLHNMSLSVDEQRDELKSFYRSIIKLLFFEMRNCSNANQDAENSLLDDCNNWQQTLHAENVWNFLPRRDLAEELDSIYKALCDLTGEKSPKQTSLDKEIIRLPQLAGKNICFLVPSDNDTLHIKQKLNFQIHKQKLSIGSMDVQTLEEFYASSSCYDSIVIAGWFNRNEMKRILFSNRSGKYLPVLYQCEYQWFSQAVRTWDSQEKLFHSAAFMGLEDSSAKPRQIAVDKRWAKQIQAPHLPEEEAIQKDYSSKLFVRSFSKSDSDKMVNAIPIAFNDGTVGYYTVGYDLLVLERNGGDITCKPIAANSIKSNSFVLFRDSSRDLLDDLTKERLGSQSEEVFEKLNRWKETIQNQLSRGRSEEEVIDALKRGGVGISDQEFRVWLDPCNGLICPGRKESLKIIGDVFHDESLRGDLEKIWAYASQVRGIHVQIGRELSESVGKNENVIQRLRALDDNDLFLKPIQMEIPNVGQVSIIKITDVDTMRKVPQRETNRRS